jgi:hypothetical protein
MDLLERRSSPLLLPPDPFASVDGLNGYRMPTRCRLSPLESIKQQRTTSSDHRISGACAQKHKNMVIHLAERTEEEDD